MKQADPRVPITLVTKADAHRELANATARIREIEAELIRMGTKFANMGAQLTQLLTLNVADHLDTRWHGALGDSVDAAALAEAALTMASLAERCRAANDGEP